MSLIIHEGGEKWNSNNGIGGYYYTGNDEAYIDDCRSFSRLEMLGFITMDVIHYNLDSAILDTLVEGPWMIHCLPTDKTIFYEGVCNENNYSYIVIFKPNLNEGINIDYMFEEFGKEQILLTSTSWSIDEIHDMIGE